MPSQSDLSVRVTFRLVGRSPQVSSLAFSARLPNLPLWLLIARASLSDANSPSLTASDRVRVPQAADLLPASSRPHLTVTPLPSASSWCNLLCKSLPLSSQRPCWAHIKRDGLSTAVFFDSPGPDGWS